MVLQQRIALQALLSFTVIAGAAWTQLALERTYRPTPAQEVRQVVEQVPITAGISPWWIWGPALILLASIWLAPYGWRAWLKSEMRRDMRSVYWFRRLVFIGLLTLLAFPSTGCFVATQRNVFYLVPPNSTAYVIDAANAKNQAKLGSIELLESNQRVPSQRVTVAYRKQKTSNALVPQRIWTPDVVVMVVERVPETRIWTQEGESDAKTQAFRMETKEAIDFWMGGTCTGTVQEKDAARFLYYFGGSALAPVALDGSDGLPPAVFRSATVASVMDRNVRGAFQARLYDAFHRLTLDEARSGAAQTFNQVAESITAAFAEQGLTLSACGGQGGMTFTDPAIQAAINKRFTETQAQQTLVDTAVAAKTAAQAQLDAQDLKNRQLAAEATGKAEVERIKQQQELFYMSELAKMAQASPGLASLVAAQHYKGDVPQSVVNGAGTIPIVVPGALPR